jgi:LacI family transcriptional regulator
MRDVAALAGVSLKTVSRVINGETTVADDLAARVQKAADALDYRPNLAASNLRRSDGRTRTIGLLLEDVANPFSSALHRAVENAAQRRGVAVLAGSLDEEPAREREMVETLVARRVDGLILVPTADDHGYLVNERRAGFGVVFADRPPQHLAADVVRSDSEAGAAEGVAHLLAQGHRRVAYLGDLLSIQTAAARFAGYTAAVARAGLTVDQRLVVHDLHTSDQAELAVARLLAGADRPTALFTSQNLVTIGAMRALRALALQREIALVGFDDFLLADLLEPAITVIAQAPATIGEVAAELLFRRLDGGGGPYVEHIVPTRLIARGSGELAVPRT